MRKTYQIYEYGSFITATAAPGSGYTTIPQTLFDQLEAFLLSNRNRDADALELMGLSARKGIGKIITAKNYIGVISMKDGTTIEILPKICSSLTDSEERTKKLVIKMLQALRSSPYKSLQTTNVNAEKLNIFEVFIRMFIDEVFLIVKRGLKCDYEALQDNLPAYKGKMLFCEQAKYNYAHKERCFVEFDDFNSNRPENRLIKATLLHLLSRSNSSKNRKDIKLLLTSFSEVVASADYQNDFSKIVSDRNTRDYEVALMWSRVFLMGKSYTAFSGSEVALALLFPMETLFESYIAALIKKAIGMGFTVSAQDKSYHLFDIPNRRFLLKPDIVIRRKEDDAIFILDTKWKLLSDDKSNYGISQSDMYQMYAYQKKYDASSVTLLYPMTDRVKKHEEIRYQSGDGVTVYVRFVDLFSSEDSISEIISAFRDC